MVKIVRLYSGVTIDLLQPITLSSTSAHYLQNVMRRKKGDKVIVFDGKSVLGFPNELEFTQEKLQELNLKTTFAI
mgnify:CR=1 FL=1